MKDRDKTLTERGIENQVEGKTDDVKGRVKDAWGSLTGDKSLEAEGKIDQMKGKIKDKVGEVQQDLDRDRDLNRPR